MPPEIQGFLESALYVADLAAARDFYQRLLGASTLLEGDRLVALALPGPGVLLLFRRGASEEALATPGGMVPGHGASGVQHVAFAITQESVAGWRAHLQALAITVESEVHWPRGGTSLYLRDPDGHSIELATPGLWATY